MRNVVRSATSLILLLVAHAALGQTLNGDSYCYDIYCGLAAVEPMRPIVAVRGDGGTEIFFSWSDQILFPPFGDSYIRRYYQNSPHSIPFVDTTVSPRCSECYNAFAGPAGVLVNSSGMIDLFGEWNYHSIYHYHQTSLTSWSLETLGGQLFSDPSPVSNSDGTFEVFAIGAHQDIWHVKQVSPGGSWGQWSNLGGLSYHDTGSLPSRAPYGYIHPMAVKNPDGRLEVFILGIDRAMWHIKQTTPGGSWGAWQSLGGSGLFWPTVAMNINGTLEIFADGMDNAVWHIQQTTAGGSWGPWKSLGGTLFNMPATVVNQDGTIEIFSLGKDGAIWHTKQLMPGGGSGWSKWASIGGQLERSPAAVRNLDGTITVISIGSLDKQMWTKTQKTPGGTWNCWTRTDGRLGSC
jgi:hypothetical protein